MSRDEGSELLEAFVCTIILFTIIGGIHALINVTRFEGYPVTVTGTILLHTLEYNKQFNYKYTEIELQTYTGQAEVMYLFDHVELDVGKTYRITYTRKSPLGFHLNLYAEILEIQEVVGG